MLFYVLITLGIYLVPKHPLIFASGLLVALHFVCSHYASFGAVPMCYSSDVVFEFVLGIVAYEFHAAFRMARPYECAWSPFLPSLGRSLA